MKLSAVMSARIALVTLVGHVKPFAIERHDGFIRLAVPEPADNETMEVFGGRIAPGIEALAKAIPLATYRLPLDGYGPNAAWSAYGGLSLRTVIADGLATFDVGTRDHGCGA